MKALAFALCLTVAGGAYGYKPLDRPLLLLVIPDITPCGKGAEACTIHKECDWEHRVCTIRVPKDRWLDCIAHEAEHANDKRWHGDKPTPCETY